jgi:hypothetical protein
VFATGPAANLRLFLDKDFGRNQIVSMHKTKMHWNTILRSETIGFSLIIVLSWLTELLRIPHYLFGEPFAPNWNRAKLRTLVILLIWAWVRWMTKKLLRRLHYLEEFLRTCSWCHKVCHKDQWMTIDEYLNTNFATRTTHGMCPECSKKWEKDFDDTLNATAEPDSRASAHPPETGSKT